MVLEKIQKENDIKNLPPEELKILAEEIRKFLIEKISVTGGHLASNLGVVELTMALHLTFDLPEDKLIWDVGHQAYTHKLLTGRKAGFDDLRKYGGMSGFPSERRATVTRLTPDTVPRRFPQDWVTWRHGNLPADSTVWYRSSGTALSPEEWHMKRSTMLRG